MDGWLVGWLDGGLVVSKNGHWLVCGRGKNKVEDRVKVFVNQRVNCEYEIKYVFKSREMMLLKREYAEK